MLKKSLAWIGLAQGVSVATQFTASVVLSRYLSPHEMGIFAVSIATVGMLSLFQQIGLNAFIVREELLTLEVSSTAFTINALIALSLSAMILGASYAGSAFLEDEGVRNVLLVLAVTPILGIFSFLPGSNLEREGRFRELALIGTATGLVNALGTIAFAIGKYSYLSAAYAQVISSSLLALMLIFAGHKHLSCRVSFHAWRRVGSFGIQMLATFGISNLSNRIAEVMMGRLLGLGALGFYNRAGSLNALIFNNINIAAGRVLFVDLADQHRRGISLRARYMQTVAIMTATLWPAFAGLAIISAPFVTFIYGPQWQAAVVPFAFLALASIVHVSITMTWEIFAAKNQLRVQTRIELVRAAFSTVLFIGACFISLEAAAATRVLDALFAVVAYRRHLNRLTETSQADFWSIYATSATLTLVAVLPVGLLTFTPGLQSPSPMQLSAAILAGMAFWGIGIYKFRHPLAAEAISILQRFVPQCRSKLTR